MFKKLSISIAPAAKKILEYSERLERPGFIKAVDLLPQIFKYCLGHNYLDFQEFLGGISEEDLLSVIHRIENEFAAAHRVESRISFENTDTMRVEVRFYLHGVRQPSATLRVLFDVESGRASFPKRCNLY